jgi:hypothetical protein
MDAAVERTGMYLQRVQKTYVDQVLYSLVAGQIRNLDYVSLP